MALIVERQTLLVPLLQTVVRHAGLCPVVIKRPTKADYLRLAPEVVVLGTDTLARPFETLRRIRSALQTTKIVVVTRRCDPVWNLMARALGADVVLGPSADSRALATAVAAG